MRITDNITPHLASVHFPGPALLEMKYLWKLVVPSFLDVILILIDSFYLVVHLQNSVITTDGQSIPLEADCHGSLLTITEFLHYPSCVLLHSRTDNLAVCEDSNSDTKQKSVDFTSIQEMKTEVNGVDVSDMKETDKEICLFGAVNCYPDTDFSSCANQ